MGLSASALDRPFCCSRSSSSRSRARSFQLAVALTNESSSTATTTGSRVQPTICRHKGNRADIERRSDAPSGFLKSVGAHWPGQQQDSAHTTRVCSIRRPHSPLHCRHQLRCPGGAGLCTGLLENIAPPPRSHALGRCGAKTPGPGRSGRRANSDAGPTRTHHHVRHEEEDAPCAAALVELVAQVRQVVEGRNLEHLRAPRQRVRPRKAGGSTGVGGAGCGGGMKWAWRGGPRRRIDPRHAKPGAGRSLAGGYERGQGGRPS